MSKICVHVVHYKDCKNLVMRYKDPVSGKWVRATKYKDPQSGVETETGQNRRLAKKLAAMWEADLNAGRDHGRQSIAWAQFRLRYEDEVSPSMAATTGRKIATVFNQIEKALPKVAGGRLADLTSEAISKLQAEWRANDLSENTIAGNLAHLHAALAWAQDQGLVLAVPKIKKPQRAKKRGKGTKAKGRPITAEEFDRMLLKVRDALVASKGRKLALDQQTRRRKGRKVKPQVPAPVEISPSTVESWRHYLRGLWLLGLRLEESLNLYWDRKDRLHIDLTGKRPMMVIPAELEKGGRDRRLPITSDALEFLEQTPEDERHGPVFSPLTLAGNRAAYSDAGKIVSLIGRLALVVVHTHPKTGKVKFASAHDLRRSFGTRWATKVPSTVLQKMMRHESFATTAAYYVDVDEDDLAETVWNASNVEKGTVSGTVGESDGHALTASNNLTRFSIDS